jgi:raffinose/stachyose/melibiose transport system substrate-binding protein
MQHARRVGGPAGRIGSIAVAVVAAVALAACSGPGSSAPASSNTAPESVSTSIGSAPVSLTLYDGAGLKKLDDALIAGFQQQYPNVTIKATYDPDDVTTQNQPRLLASETPPDLARVISVTDGVKNGLLTNLDAYSTAYGWDKLPASQLTQYRVTDGVAGSGSLYAKPSGFTIVGLYYNKALADQIGMTTPPASVDELTTLMGKAKAAGLVPLNASNQAGATVMAYQLMLNTSLGTKAVSDWVFTVPDATIDTPDGVAPATTLDNWVKQGYLPEGVNGTDSSAALSAFTSGNSVFWAWGNWEATNLDKGLSGNVGFMPMPPMEAGGDVAAMSDAATAFGIAAKSANKDAAAAFLNYLSSDEARQAAIDSAYMPTGTADQPAPTIPADSVLNDVVMAFQDVSEANGQVPFVQNATAGISDRAWTPESQLLLAGQSTPEQFVTNVQTEYEKEAKK